MAWARLAGRTSAGHLKHVDSPLRLSSDLAETRSETALRWLPAA